MKKISNKTKCILALNWITIITVWILHKKSTEELDKINNSSEKNINELEYKKLKTTLTDYITWLEYYSKIFVIFGITLTTLTVIEILYQQIFFPNKPITKEMKKIFNLSEKLTFNELKEIKIKLSKININIPKFKTKYTLLQQTNIILETINNYLDNENKTNYQQYLNELYTLKSWLENQKSLFICKTKKDNKQQNSLITTSIIPKTNQSVNNITKCNNKELSSHFLENLWPKWFNSILTIEEQTLLNIAYQKAKEKEEKKFWKLLKENKEIIKNKGIKHFLEITFKINKTENKIANIVNQELLFSDIKIIERKQKLNLT
ncbi:MAG: hypothetical protein PPFGHCPK_01058 [Spiroplasma endosymbiont of Drosophila atripex]|nr:MAG: hypothetical protein PPFGHCPK_01058 [Spiroplasma endosymbiont of Drosophila atripex]